MSGQAEHFAHSKFELKVNTGDRFFFDHPLDHVPGMLLFNALLRDAQRAALVSSTVVAARVTFLRFCEIDAPAFTLVRPERNSSCHVRLDVEQRGVVVCSGAIEWSPVECVPITAVQSNKGRPTPTAARAELVHKRHPENVMVGPLSHLCAGGFATAVIPPDRDRADALHPLTLIVEAVRQLATMMAHSAANIPLGWQLIVSSIDVRMMGAFTWTDPIELHCVENRHGRGRGGGNANVMVGGKQVGSIAVAGRAVSPATYVRLRDMSKAGA